MACYFPFKKEGTPLPCGKCPYCLSRRANNWVFRCIQEAKIATCSTWVTLTYENPSITPNGFMTVQKSTFQKFMKRLRKSYPKDHPKIKYFACGEYGDETERPHYHAVIFNADPESIEKAWQGSYIHVCETTGDIQEIKLGICHFDEVNENTVMYTAKYMMKAKKVPKFKADDRNKEFQLFSKGLGSNYLSPDVLRWHQEDPERLFVTVSGFKKALPRYFRLQIYNEEQREQQAQLAQEKANNEYDKQYKQFLKSRSFNQTFEQWRFSKKNNALDYFRRVTTKRKKL